MDEERKAYEKRRLNANALRALITEGETVLWEGAPKSNVRLHRNERSNIPVGIVMAGMSLYGAFTLYSELKNGEPFSLATVVGGIVLLFVFCGRLLSDFWKVHL